MITVSCDCCGQLTGYCEKWKEPPFVKQDTKLEWKILCDQDINEICEPCFKTFVELYQDAIKTIFAGFIKVTTKGCTL